MQLQQHSFPTRASVDTQQNSSPDFEALIVSNLFKTQFTIKEVLIFQLLLLSLRVL